VELVIKRIVLVGVGVAEKVNESVWRVGVEVGMAG
jgi:hypothetical protein